MAENSLNFENISASDEEYFNGNHVMLFAWIERSHRGDLQYYTEQVESISIIQVFLH